MHIVPKLEYVQFILHCIRICWGNFEMFSKQMASYFSALKFSWWKVYTFEDNSLPWPESHWSLVVWPCVYTQDTESSPCVTTWYIFVKVLEIRSEDVKVMGPLAKTGQLTCQSSEMWSIAFWGCWPWGLKPAVDSLICVSGGVGGRAHKTRSMRSEHPEISMSLPVWMVTHTRRGKHPKPEVSNIWRGVM